MTDEPVRDSLVKNADLVRGNTVSLSDLLRCAEQRDALRDENEHLKLWLDDRERSLVELRAEDDERRRQDAARAQAVVDDLDVPEVVRWAEAVTLQPRVSLPADVYDALRAENERLRAALDALIDDEPCRFDHEGFCQTHLLGRPCEVAAARKLLREVTVADVASRPDDV